MTLFCVGLSHHNSMIDQREAYATADHDLASVLQKITEAPEVDEAALLSTCNRVEFYLEGKTAVPEAVFAALSRSWDDLGRRPGVELARVEPLRDANASRHLMRVACGLESMVLGESQILGQVTAAYRQALAAQTTGPVLSALFQAAIHCGKQAHSQTPISRGNVSIGTVALGLARRHTGDLHSARVAIVGAGELAHLVAHQAAKLGAGHLRILNRTVSRAAALAEEVHGLASGLDELPAAVAWADVLVSTVGGSQPVVTDSELERSDRTPRPLVLIDLSMPRTIDITLEHWPQTSLFGLDDVQRVGNRGAAQRQTAIPQVEAIVEREHDAFCAWLAARDAVPAMVALRHKARLLADIEVERTLRLLGDVDPSVAARVNELAHRLTNKFLHEPTVRLQASASAGDGERYANAVRHLFAIEGSGGEYA